MFNSELGCVGNVHLLIEHRSGKQESIQFPNTILKQGRRALALCLANQIGSSFSFFVTRMLFGDGGTEDGVKKYVNADRNGLFGVTRLSKPIIATMDASVLTQVTFTSVVTFEDAVGVTLNEMALQLSNGNLFSMTTFPDLNKTAELQLTYTWAISFV